MKILTVDIGNTCIKGSIFENSELIDSCLLEERDAKLLKPIICRYQPEGAISCCVGGNDDEFVKELEAVYGKPVMRFSHKCELPIKVNYRTFDTLGLDRIAAAVGAVANCKDALVVDAGTAVTLDLVAGGEFRGGNISPGLRLRLRSLNKFTSRLPLVNPNGDTPRLGYDTATAIRSGVVNGIVSEICSTYKDATEKMPNLALLLTGGDADFFAPLLEQKGLHPQIDHSLVGRGLEEIFKLELKMHNA